MPRVSWRSSHASYASLHEVSYGPTSHLEPHDQPISSDSTEPHSVTSSAQPSKPPATHRSRSPKLVTRVPPNAV